MTQQPENDNPHPVFQDPQLGSMRLCATACAGENICFEVMANTVKWMRSRPGQRVFRARFSAISRAEVQAAMVRNLSIEMSVCSKYLNLK